MWELVKSKYLKPKKLPEKVTYTDRTIYETLGDFCLIPKKFCVLCCPDNHTHYFESMTQCPRVQRCVAGTSVTRCLGGKGKRAW